MAKKGESLGLERTYTIPLRKEFLKVPRYKRAKKAVNAVREFLVRHMKAKEIKLGEHLNKELWKNGIKNPPHHVKVIATRDGEGLVTAELVTVPKVKEAKRKIKEKLVSKKGEGVESKLKEAAEPTTVSKQETAKEAASGETPEKVLEKPAEPSNEAPKPSTIATNAEPAKVRKEKPVSLGK